MICLKLNIRQKFHVNLGQPSCDTLSSRVPFFLNLPMHKCSYNKYFKSY